MEIKLAAEWNTHWLISEAICLDYCFRLDIKMIRFLPQPQPHHILNILFESFDVSFRTIHIINYLSIILFGSVTV